MSPAERGAFRALLEWGLVDAYRLQHDEPGRFTWWDYRAGMFHKNFGMRIDHLLVTKRVAARVVAAEIDREARKGPPIPSDHAPLTIDLDKPGQAVRPGLGRRAQADRLANEGLTEELPCRGAALARIVWRGIQPVRPSGVLTWRKPSYEPTTSTSSPRSSRPSSRELTSSTPSLRRTMR